MATNRTSLLSLISLMMSVSGPGRGGVVVFHPLK